MDNRGLEVLGEFRAFIDGAEKMQELLDSRSPFIRQSGNTIDVPHLGRNLYSILQQEVVLGGQALKRESADMAVTLFQSALQKLTIDQPFYDHLVHNLLLSYKLLIEQLLKQGDTSTALDFLRAALRLEIRGEMAEDSRSSVNSPAPSRASGSFSSKTA